MDQDLPTTELAVRAFAKSGGTLHGAAPLSAFARVASDCEAAGVGRVVEWSAAGAMSAGARDTAQPLLHLRADTVLALVCQRCLEPLDVAVAVDQWFRFVADEETAAVQDDDSPQDLLVESPHFDLRALLEDELVLAMPLVPLHPACPTTPRLSARDPGFDDADDPRPHPFAALAGLKPAGRKG